MHTTTLALLIKNDGLKPLAALQRACVDDKLRGESDNVANKR